MQKPLEIDHSRYPLILKGTSDGELYFIIHDCKAAIAAMPDGPKAGYYADEIHYASMELARRRKKEVDRSKAWAVAAHDSKRFR